MLYTLYIHLPSKRQLQSCLVASDSAKEAHNELRAEHGAGKLEWNDEQLCAD